MKCKLEGEGNVVRASIEVPWRVAICGGVMVSNGNRYIRVYPTVITSDVDALTPCSQKSSKLWLMKIFYPILTIFLAHVLALDGLQVPLTNKPSQKSLISPETELYIDTLLGRWNSSGLSVAVVHQDTTNSNGWHYEFGGYGVARADGSPVTLDTVFAIASNSKLFLALSVGLLIANETLAKERGESITWSTKARHLIPEWELMEKDMDRGVSIQDMLSHRTGMPRHDFSGIQRKGGVPEMVCFSDLNYSREI